MNKKTIAGASLLSLCLLAGAANAVEVEFDLGDYDSREGVVSNYWSTSGFGTYAEEYNYDVDGLGLSITGWSYDWEWNKTGWFWERTVDNTIGQALVGDWSPYGLGVERAFSPQHAIDNSMGDYDMLLLSFDEAVSLDELTIGWEYTANSDATVMAFTGDQGTENISSMFSGKAWEDLLNEDWSLIGDSYQVSTNAPTSINEGGTLSRYWLVGAYNENVGASSEASAQNDFFKLSSISVSVNPVPLPGSLVLFGSALLLFGSLQRKKKAA